MSEMNDSTLQKFLQQLVMGIDGLQGFNVIPRWQAEPPLIKNFGTNWASIGVMRKIPDRFAYVKQETVNKQCQSQVYRNEILEVLLTFYGPNAEANIERFTMGLQIPQNREMLQNAGYGVVDIGDPVMMAEEIKQRWTRRVDVLFTLRRAALYTYAVPNVKSATIELHNEVEDITITVVPKE